MDMSKSFECLAPAGSALVMSIGRDYSKMPDFGMGYDRRGCAPAGYACICPLQRMPVLWYIESMLFAAMHKPV
jgi:hypothetical protein